MKIPLPIQPARVDYDSRDIIPIRFSHALAAAVGLPLFGFACYVVARLIFSIPS